MKASILSKVHGMTDNQLKEVAFQLAEMFPDTFEEVILGAETESFTVPFTDGDVIRLSKADVRELRAFPADRKVSAIKYLREVTSLGLKEAKDVVEAFFIPRTAPIGNY